MSADYLSVRQQKEKMEDENFQLREGLDFSNFRNLLNVNIQIRLID